MYVRIFLASHGVFLCQCRLGMRLQGYCPRIQAFCPKFCLTAWKKFRSKNLFPRHTWNQPIMYVAIYISIRPCVSNTGACLFHKATTACLCVQLCLYIMYLSVYLLWGTQLIGGEVEGGVREKLLEGVALCREGVKVGGQLLLRQILCSAQQLCNGWTVETQVKGVVLWA